MPSVLSRKLGFEDRQTFAIGLAELDPETGAAILPPFVRGFWNIDKKKVDLVFDRDLTKELHDACEKENLDLHLRGKGMREKEMALSSESKE